MESFERDSSADRVDSENGRMPMSGLTAYASPSGVGDSAGATAAAPSFALASFASSPAILPTQIDSAGSKRGRMDLDNPDDGLRRNRSKTGLGIASRYASTGLLVRKGVGGAPGGGGQQGGANADWGFSTLEREESTYNHMRTLQQQPIASGGWGIFGGAGGLGQTGARMTMVPMGTGEIKMAANNSSSVGMFFPRSQAGRTSAPALRQTNRIDFVSMMGLERPQQKKQQPPPQTSQLTPDHRSLQSQSSSIDQMSSLSKPSMEMATVRGSGRLSDKRSSLLSVDEDMGESLGGSSMYQSEGSERSTLNFSSIKNKEIAPIDIMKEEIDVGSLGSFDQGPQPDGEDASLGDVFIKADLDFDFEDVVNDDVISIKDNSETELNPASISSINSADKDVNKKDGEPFGDLHFGNSDDDVKKEMSDYEGMDLEPTPLSTEQERMLEETRHHGSNGFVVTLEDNNGLSQGGQCRGAQQEELKFMELQSQLPPLPQAPTRSPEKENINESPTLTKSASDDNLQKKACNIVAAGGKEGHETPETASVDGSAEGEGEWKAGFPGDRSFIVSLNRMVNEKHFKSHPRSSDEEKQNGSQSGAYIDRIADAILALNNGSPTTSDADGMLPIHLACIYCPNNKRLVGSILIDNPDTARLCIETRQPSDDDLLDGAKSETSSSKSEHHSSSSASSDVLIASRKKVISASAVSMLQGSFPLHLALRSVTGEKVTYEVVKLLSLAAPDVLTSVDKAGTVPLSVALQHRVGSQIVRYLLQQSRSSAKIADKKKNFPLHFACTHVNGKKEYSFIVIKLVTEAYPYAIVQQNDDGKTPVDLAEELPAARTVVAYLNNQMSLAREQFS
mmetsp:Transcript_37842/g.56648  ORF Transcript_37842/g.56648 Transcript_37842/m.56648 type:complete len:849 (-) Transcript_37842:738-3284(-)